MLRKLLFPDDARRWLQRRYDHQHRSWLTGAGAWPLTLALADVTEKHVTEDAALIRTWVEAWSAWTGRGQLQWDDRHWPRLGQQRLPVRLSVASALDVAEIIGDAVRWQCSSQRYEVLAQRWSALHGATSLLRHSDALADYTEHDFQRLFELITWFEQNRESGHYLRQLPVAGIDTKWIDAKRRGLVADLLQDIRGPGESSDFHALCGLRRAPHRIRIRVLCPRLRERVGGICDLEAPLDELTTLPLEPTCVLILENLETGIALPDQAGCVAIMKLGMGVGVLAALPWVLDRPAIYWGDIDTHGFAILDRARAAVPRLRSVMMDEATLLATRALWGREAEPHRDVELPRLNVAERAMFDQLRANRWGQNVRLEQERVPWSYALAALHAAADGSR